MQFHIPTKPFTATDAINRIWIATGSVRLAQAHHHGSEINGHHNTLYFNNYRRYWVGEFNWAGRNVFVRSSDFAEALSVAIREFDSQGKGATLIVEVESPEDIAICRANPRLVEGAEVTITPQALSRSKSNSAAWTPARSRRRILTNHG